MREAEGADIELRGLYNRDLFFIFLLAVSKITKIDNIVSTAIFVKGDFLVTCTKSGPSKLCFWLLCGFRR